MDYLERSVGVHEGRIASLQHENSILSSIVEQREKQLQAAREIMQKQSKHNSDLIRMNTSLQRQNALLRTQRKLISFAGLAAVVYCVLK